MKRKINCGLMVVILIVSLSGCSQSSSTKVLSDGYEEVTTTRNSMLAEPALIQSRLEYRRNGKIILVWPVIRSDVFIKDGIATFIVDRSEDRYRDGRWETGTHLFMVEGSNTPVDVTAELVRRWARDSGKDETQATKAAALIGGKEVPNNALSFYFEFNGGIWAGVHISPTWAELLDMLKEVKSKGSIKKDPTFGLKYVE